MTIYTTSIRNGNNFYASYTGMNETIVRNLLINLGCTNINLISEQEFLNNLPQITLGE